MEVPLIGIIITLIFSAFFSGLEIAYISSNRLKIELDKSKGTITSKILSRFYKKESDFIAMLLLGNNIALVVFGLFSAELLEPIIVSWGIPVTEEGLILLIQTLLSTALVLITAEFLPKAFVQLNPNRVLRYASVPMFVVYGVLYLPTQIVVMFSNLALRLLKVDNENSEKVFSKVDLEDYVQDMNERIKDEEELGNEFQILQNALDFDSVKARDCMVPRIEIEAVELNDPIDHLKQRFIETGYSKILVYRDHVDNVIGYVHSFEIFKSPTSIKEILLPIAFVPEAKSGMQLLQMFGENSGNIAVVVDEYGGTAGVVTIEDVIEEIFGEIEDEYDVEELLEEEIGDGEYRFSARQEIDYLNASFDLSLEESEEYETLGGLIIHHLENIPEAGTKVEIGQHTFEIEEVSQHRIETIRVRK
jgi:CBS domain containing-hemolysin-like protein